MEAEKISRENLFKELRNWYNEKKGTDLDLKQLLQDKERISKFVIEGEDFILDYSKQHLNCEALKKLDSICQDLGLFDSIEKMRIGEKINSTENRPVLHYALRSNKSDELVVDGVDIVKQVHCEQDKMKEFSEKVRSGQILGVTGKRIQTILSIGIGGSYLGVLTAYNAIKCTKKAFVFEIEGRKS